MNLDRLKMLVGLRVAWREQVAEVRRMRAWIIQTEHILAGQWAAPGATRTNETVGQRFEAWCRQLAQLATSEPLSTNEQDCLANFLKVTADLRPQLIQCYDVKDFPRTNNDLERYIRASKTRYRRVSGRKNWNAYLLRYGSCIAYYDWIEPEQMDAASFELMLGRVGHQRWRQTRAQWRQEQSAQLKMYRFRRCLRERLIVASDTPSSCTISSRGWP